MRALADNGQPDVAYTIATQKTYPGWAFMIQKGATTIWELWNGDTADPAMNSGNHVMQIGDLDMWLYEYLAGIRSDPDKLGFQHTVIRPVPSGDLTFAKASHTTMYGGIHANWRRDRSSLTLDISIPANTTATVYLPAKNANFVTESGRPAAQARGVHFSRTQRGVAVYDIGSGSYSFRSN